MAFARATHQVLNHNHASCLQNCLEVDMGHARVRLLDSQYRINRGKFMVKCVAEWLEEVVPDKVSFRLHDL